MPTTSIDTFFACSLLVSVVIIATAFLAGTMQTQINSMQTLNKPDFLRALSDRIVSGCGSLENWGSSGGVPLSFGLSEVNCQGLNEIDADKICRLNSQNDFALSYTDALKASSLSNVAFGVSISQMLQIEVTFSGSSISEDFTSYSFQISVNQGSAPVMADLHCYVLTSDFENNVTSSTDSSGNGYVSAEIPNSASGPGMLVVFARASFDDRVTAYTVFPFATATSSPEPNLTFLDLSPLNYELNVTAKNPSTFLTGAYAFSFSYQSNLTSNSEESTYLIPQLVDSSPIVLVVSGVCELANFNEWVAYPQVPMNFGADLSNSESNVFVYPVTINGCLYELTMRFGSVFN